MDRAFPKPQTKPWYAPRGVDEIEPFPWLHPHAVEYFEALLRPEWKVLEHGAGGSTLWLAERVAKVVSFEHDPVWRKKVRELAGDNVKILSQVIMPEEIFIGNDWDLFFIDGKREERGLCISLAHEYVKPGGWLVLDNSNRPEYAKEREGLKNRAKLMARFDNNIPQSYYFVTEFWQCASA